jgi:hypothetical protein
MGFSMLVLIIFRYRVNVFAGSGWQHHHGDALKGLILSQLPIYAHAGYHIEPKCLNDQGKTLSDGESVDFPSESNYKLNRNRPK